MTLVLGCEKHSSEKPIEFDEAQLLHTVKVISADSMQGRFFGTAGNFKAQKYIAQQFDSIGILPAFPSGSIQKYEHTFTGAEKQKMYPADALNIVADTTVTGGNVVTMLKGKTEKAIVITAHFDHLGIKKGKIFNGADDNASGAAALLTIANYFKQNPPKHTLIFAAVDAEEIGSFGCAYLINHFPIPVKNIALNVNMDMISHNDSKELYLSGLYHYPNLKKALDGFTPSKIKLLYGHDNPYNILLEDWTYSSDHRIFHEKKIPFIYFGVEDHKDYHKATDTYDHINKEFYVDAVRLIIEVIENYDSFLDGSSK